MSYKNASGNYENGVAVSKNGVIGSGLNCAKGQRLYRTDIVSPIFFMPKDSPDDEK